VHTVCPKILFVPVLKRYLCSQYHCSRFLCSNQIPIIQVKNCKNINEGDCLLASSCLTTCDVFVELDSSIWTLSTVAGTSLLIISYIDIFFQNEEFQASSSTKELLS